MKKLKLIPEKNHIKIEIYGMCGVGKSAIAYEIANMLTNYGIKTEIMPDDDKLHDVKWVLKNKVRMESIRIKTCVTIEERKCTLNGEFQEKEYKS